MASDGNNSDAKAAQNISETSEMMPKPLPVHTVFHQFDSISELLSALTDATDEDMAVLQGVRVHRPR